MDDPLRDSDDDWFNNHSYVLILVVMDDPLRVILSLKTTKAVSSVLILVVMDDPLRDKLNRTEAKDAGCLNPCCNG